MLVHTRYDRRHWKRASSRCPKTLAKRRVRCEQEMNSYKVRLTLFATSSTLQACCPVNWLRRTRQFRSCNLVWMDRPLHTNSKWTHWYNGFQGILINVLKNSAMTWENEFLRFCA